MPRKKIAEAIGDAASDARKKKAKEATKLKLGSMFKPMRGALSNVEEFLPSGLEVLDRYVLGGGWPVKRVVELFSDPGAGKTSLCFSAMASAQRAGGVAILIETENALQVARATIFGVNLDDVYLSEPASIEEVVEAMREGLSHIPKGSGPNFLGWDSLAMSSLAATNEKGMGAKSMGRRAAIMSEQLSPIARACRESRTAMMIVNQVRSKIGVVFGNPTTTPGGETHKFVSSVRLQLWAGKQVKIGTKPVGVATTVKAVKNRMTEPHRKAKVRLLFTSGWDDHWTTLNYAKDCGVVEKKLKLTETNYALARAELGWDGEGTPWPTKTVQVDDDDEDDEWDD